VPRSSVSFRAYSHLPRQQQVPRKGEHEHDRALSSCDGSGRAAGGDKNGGSDTTAVLALADAISDTGICFLNYIRVVLLGGEEQRLLESKVYARAQEAWRERG
jgi:hypothetical protein